MTNSSFEIEELEKKVQYFQKNAEQLTRRIMRMDLQAMATRRELEQKRRGFSLMASLAISKEDADDVLVSVSRRINSALNMQRTVILVPAEKGEFKPLLLQGFSREEKENLMARTFVVEEEMLNPAKPVLVSSATPISKLVRFRVGIGIPYFISAPIAIGSKIIAILITGRLVEEWPYLLPLNKSDVETVHTVCTYLAAIIAGKKTLLDAPSE